MVQRTRLAVVILMALVAVSFLTAQETAEFTPPRLLSEPVLDLPADLANPPADVLILVEVKADSTAALIRILDGKETLKSHIEELLPYLLFMPSYQNGVPVNSTLTIKLQVRQEKSLQKLKQAESDSLKIVNKELLYQSIKERLIKENLQNMFSDKTFYRTNYYLAGLNSDSELIIKDGFIELPRVYGNALHYQILSNFRELHYRNSNTIIKEYNEYIPQWKLERLEIRGHGKGFTLSQASYPWSATLTDVYAGLGDYEYNFAKGQVLKNHLFGVKNFYTELGFLFQNGWWQETISGQTSGRLYLSIPIKDTKLDFNYESYDQDIPSTSLLPGLQNGNLYTIAQRRNELYLKWALPWFTTGWQTGREKLRAPGILIPQDYETGQFLLRRDFHLLATDFDLTYQYNYKNTIPEVQTLYQFNKRTRHQGLIRTEHYHSRFSNKNLVLVSEDGLEMVNVLMDYELGSTISSGVNYKFHNGQDGSFTEDSLYIDSNFIHSPSAFSMRTFSANLKWLLSNSFYVKLEGGSRIYVTDTYSPTLSSDIHKEVDRPFVELKLSAEKDIFDLVASWEQTLQWTQYRKGLYELPEMQGQTRLKLTRDMGHNNALSAGLNLTGHTDYIEANSIQTPVSGSLIADAWLGVKITDLFEFQLMLKNIGDNNVFGIYPIPRAIMGTIHWFFLN